MIQFIRIRNPKKMHPLFLAFRPKNVWGSLEFGSFLHSFSFMRCHWFSFPEFCCIGRSIWSDVLSEQRKKDWMELESNHVLNWSGRGEKLKRSTKSNFFRLTIPLTLAWNAALTANTRHLRGTRVASCFLERLKRPEREDPLKQSASVKTA